MSYTVIIANGTLPPRRIVQQTLSKAKCIICADGGANAARKLRVKPNVIIGDMDSISPLTRRYYKNIPFRFIPNQNSTDLEKALNYCIRHRMRTVCILGATGNRLDHTTGGLGCFKKYGSRLNITMIDKEGIIRQIRKKVNLKTERGERLSLIPLNRCTGVTTKNLKYGLKSGVLELGVREGISNEATAPQVSIRVKKGTLLLYRFNT